MNQNGTALAHALSNMRDAFPRQPFGDQAVRIYAEQLADLDGQDVLAAVTRLLRSSPYMPTIFDIRREVVEHISPMPTMEQAWDQAVAGHTDSTLVRETIEACGGFWEIRRCTNLGTLRSQFRKDYEARRSEAVKAMVVGTPIQPEQLAPPDVAHLSNGRRVRTVRELPETTRVQPRPTARLMALRYAGASPDLHPTQDEMADAILILRDGPDPDVNEDPLYREAEATFARANGDRT